jgi:glycine betaine/choline ABC-type transport system substrate-binding protein
VKTLDEQQNDIIWLQPAPANNTWGIAIPKSFSDSQNIKTLADFANFVNKGGQIKLASKLPGRDEMEGFARWRIKQMANYNIKSGARAGSHG